MSPTLSPGLLPRAGPSAELAPCRTLATLGVVLVAAAQTDWSFTFVVILTITARTRAWIRAEGGRAVDVIGRSVAKRRAFCRNGTLLHACPPGGSTCWRAWPIVTRESENAQSRASAPARRRSHPAPTNYPITRGPGGPRALIGRACRETGYVTGCTSHFRGASFPPLCNTPTASPARMH